MTAPEPPIDDPEPSAIECPDCGCTTCECDRAYETYRDRQMEDA